MISITAIAHARVMRLMHPKTKLCQRAERERERTRITLNATWYCRLGNSLLCAGTVAGYAMSSSSMPATSSMVGRSSRSGARQHLNHWHTCRRAVKETAGMITSLLFYTAFQSSYGWDKKSKA